MRAEFQVWQQGKCIYRMDFPIDEKWQFGEFSKVAVDDFHDKFPAISLLDVEIKWGSFDASWT